MSRVKPDLHFARHKSGLAESIRIKLSEALSATSRMRPTIV